MRVMFCCLFSILVFIEFFFVATFEHFFMRQKRDFFGKDFFHHILRVNGILWNYRLPTRLVDPPQNQ